MVGVLCVGCTIKLCILVPLPALLQGGSKRRVFDLFEDLKDGLILMDLMKILTGEEMVGEGTYHMLLHYNALSLNCDNTTTYHHLCHYTTMHCHTSFSQAKPGFGCC